VGRAKGSIHLEMPPMLASVAVPLISFLVLNGRSAAPFAMTPLVMSYLPVGLVGGWCVADEESGTGLYDWGSDAL
jgi:hypothetical protein